MIPPTLKKLVRLEKSLVAPEDWTTCGAPEEAVKAAKGGSSKGVPTGLVHSPDRGWCVLETTGQGPTLVWQQYKTISQDRMDRLVVTLARKLRQEGFEEFRFNEVKNMLRETLKTMFVEDIGGYHLPEHFRHTTWVDKEWIWTDPWTGHVYLRKRRIW